MATSYDFDLFVIVGGSGGVRGARMAAARAERLFLRAPSRCCAKCCERVRGRGRGGGEGAPFSFCCETMVLSLFCSSYAEKTEVEKEDGEGTEGFFSCWFFDGVWNGGVGSNSCKSSTFMSFVHVGRK